MKAKHFEALLAADSGLASDIVTRFQSLRSFKLLPNSRGRNAENLEQEHVVSGILSLAADKPGFAGTTAIGLRSMKPVGLPEDAFAEAETLAAAISALLSDQALLDSLVEVRLGNSDPISKMATCASIIYRAPDGVRTTHYVPRTALSLFHKGAEKDFDPGVMRRSVATDVIIYPRLFARISREIANAKKIFDLGF